MKTPEEIKKGLECCLFSYTSTSRCCVCPYEISCYATKPRDVLMKDALAYAQQLEAQAPKWISAKEPPKEEKEYIVLRECWDGAVERTTDIFVNGRWGCDGTVIKVVAWMDFDALPGLPEGWKP